jgi:hypothetical protein
MYMFFLKIETLVLVTSPDNINKFMTLAWNALLARLLTVKPSFQCGQDKMLFAESGALYN